MVKVIQDLESGDSCKGESALNNQNHQMVKEQLRLSEKKYGELSERHKICEQDNSDKDLIIEKKDEQITLKEKEAKKQKRQKNWFIGGGSTAVVIIIVLAILL